MYFQFACPKCSKNLKVREENVGSRVRCPYCHHSMMVKAPKKEPSRTSISGGGAASDTDKQTAESGLEKSSAETSDSGSSDYSSSAGWSDGTEVSGLKSALISVGLSLVFYAIIYGANLAWPGNYFCELFLDRGWVPFVLVYLFNWSASILFLKSRKLARQKNSMLFDLLPNEISEGITAEIADQFVKHIRKLPANQSESFLINRVLRGLEHFRVLKSNPEVASRLASQSEIDATAVESSYTILKVFIWAIPILGFIGTVIGISGAVGGFQSGLESAQEISKLKESLGSVTGGLSTAFDTTLVALVMSILVMFPASSMQKAEEDLLNWVDEYCNENLLKRLKDGDRGLDRGSNDTKAIQKAIDAAMATHHAELRTWTKKLESIGSTLTQQVVKGWGDVDVQLQAKHQENMGEIKQTVSSVIEKQQAMVMQIGQMQTELALSKESHVKQFESIVNTADAQSRATSAQVEQHRQQVEQNLGRMVDQLEKTMGALSSAVQTTAEVQSRAAEQNAQAGRQHVEQEMGTVVGKFEQAMIQLVEQSRLAQDQVAGSMQTTAESFNLYFDGLNEGLTSLNGVLAGLGEKQVVIEARLPVEVSSPTSPRRGWKWFGGKNGAKRDG